MGPLARHGQLSNEAKRQQFLPFSEALRLARSLRLVSQAEWRLWCRIGARPANVPAGPPPGLRARRVGGVGALALPREPRRRHGAGRGAWRGEAPRSRWRRHVGHGHGQAAAAALSTEPEPPRPRCCPDHIGTPAPWSFPSFAPGMANSKDHQNQRGATSTTKALRVKPALMRPACASVKFFTQQLPTICVYQFNSIQLNWKSCPSQWFLLRAN